VAELIARRLSWKMLVDEGKKNVDEMIGKSVAGEVVEEKVLKKGVEFVISRKKRMRMRMRMRKTVKS
jgi:hypothetical protein